ncbi:MAG: M16 family metallopeptidase [Bacteroidales bacterium]
MKDPGLNRKEAPKPVDFSKLPLDDTAIGFSRIKAEKFMLSNGIPVYWIKMGQTDIMKIEVIFNAGFYYQPSNLIASFTNHLIKEGTNTLSSAAIAETIDYFGSSLSNDTDKDRASTSLYAQTKHLQYLIPLLADIIYNPSFPEKEFDILLQNKRQQFLVDMQRVSYLAGRKMQELMYGKGHPYGISLEESDFIKIRLDQIKEFYSRYYTPSNCTIVVAGPDYQPLYKLLDLHLGNIDRSQEQSYSVMNFPEMPDVPSGEDFFIAKEGALQNAIRIGTRSITPSHPDYTALKVLNTLFGGYFGSRLMKNIREDKGYTYGIGSTLIPYQKTGAFIIYSEVGATIAHKAMDEIFFELERLQQYSYPEEELTLVKNYMVGSFLRSIDGVFEVASRYKEMLFFGLADDHYRQALKEIQEITPEKLQSIAKQYLNPSLMFKLMAGSA